MKLYQIHLRDHDVSSACVTSLLELLEAIDHAPHTFPRRALVQPAAVIIVAVAAGEPTKADETEAAESSVAVSTPRAVLEAAGTILGYVAYLEAAPEAYITSCCVVETERRRGVASRLVQATQTSLAAKAGSRLRLHALEGSSAIKLYEACGFSFRQFRRDAYGRGTRAVELEWKAPVRRRAREE
jgi:ribosomal protein S18 acetylase RimI-like enzyme